MAALLKPGLKTSLVEALYNEILTNSNNYYYFLGKTLPWSPLEGDSPVPGTSLREESETRDEIIFMKKITSADVSFVIPQYLWSSGTIYDMYDDFIGGTVEVGGCNGTQGNYTLYGTFDLSVTEIGLTVQGDGVTPGTKILNVSSSAVTLDQPLEETFSSRNFTFVNLPYSGVNRLSISKFYVITSESHVYKCLYNNNGNPSTVKPFSTSSDIIKTSDGYIWKYMYTVPVALANRFTTPTDIPVTTSIKAQYFSQGSLQSATILSYGEGYDPDTTVLDIGGDGNREGNRWKLLSTGLIDNGYGYQEESIIPVSVTSIRAGYRYEIFFTGTTDFTLYGAESNDVGTVFYSESDDVIGTGTVLPLGPVITWDPPYTYTDFLPETQYLVGEYVRNPALDTIYIVDVAGVSGTTSPIHTKTSTVYNGTAGFRFVGIAATGASSQSAEIIISGNTGATTVTGSFSTSLIQPGDTLSGFGIVTGTTVLQVNTNSLVLDTAINQNLTNATVIFRTSRILSIDMKSVIGYVNLTNVGYGYDPVTPPVVTVNTSTGTGAEIKASVAGSSRLSGLIITARGDNYLSSDTCSITPPFPTTAHQSWAQVVSSTVSLGETILVGGNVYEVTIAGTLSSVYPTHQSGSQSCGTATLTFVDQVVEAHPWGSVDNDVVVENDVFTYGSLFFRVLNGGTLGVTPPEHNWGVAVNGDVQVEFIGQNAAAQIDFFLGYGYNNIPNVTIDPPINITAINAGTPDKAYQWIVGTSGVSKGDIIYNQGLYYHADPGVVWSSGLTVAQNDVIYVVDQNVLPSTEDYIRFYYVSDVTGGTTLGTSSPTHTGGEELNGQVYLTYIGTANIINFTSSGTFSSVLPPTTRSGWSINGTVALNVIGVQAVGTVATLKTNAKYVPVIQNGQIVSVVAIDPGVGYTVADIEVQSQNGSGAQIEFNLSTGDVNTRQSNVELLAVPGSIEVIKVIRAGNNYAWAQVEVVGDGEGCTAKATIVNGAITKIDVLTPGSGYSQATVIITGNDTAAATPAYARAIISPLDGHGNNAIRELFATDITLSTTIALDANQGFKVKNDYRQLGIIKNPLEYGTGLRYTAASGSTCYSVTGQFDWTKLSNDMLMTDNYGREYRLVAFPETAPSINVSQFSVLLQSIKIGTAPKSSKVSITNATWSDNTATFTTSEAHGLKRGNPFVVFGVKSSTNLNSAFNAGYNRKFMVIDAPSSTTITCQLIYPIGDLVGPGTYGLGPNSSYTGQLNNLSSFNYNTPLQVGDVLYYTFNNTTYQVAISALTPPNINKYTGDVLFIDNRAAFQPNEDQTISFKTAIRL